MSREKDDEIAAQRRRDTADEREARLEAIITEARQMRELAQEMFRHARQIKARLKMPSEPARNKHS